MNKVLAALVFLAGGPVLADEFDGTHTLTVEDRAKIELDQDKQHKAIDEKYKDDTSLEGQAAKRRETDEADSQVLEKHGSSDHEYRTQALHESPTEDKEVAAKKDELRAKEEADAKAKAQAPKEKEGPIEVIKGFDEDHPLNVDEQKSAPKKAPALDENGNPVPTVEKGFTDEEMAAKAGGESSGGEKSETPKDTVIAVPPSVEPGTQVIDAPASPP